MVETVANSTVVLRSRDEELAHLAEDSLMFISVFNVKCIPSEASRRSRRDQSSVCHVHDAGFGRQSIEQPSGRNLLHAGIVASDQ